MLCLYRSGRQAEALGAYQRLRRRLGEELGLEPGAALRDLESEILQQSSSLEWTAPLGQVPVSSIDSFRGRLPAQLSQFVGREQEQSEVADLLAATRLVTLVGPGGMGKTRLALQVAAGAVGRFPQGVWFVELAPVEDAVSLDHAFAAALGFHPESGSTARRQLLESLGTWEALLVVDNCEHVLAATGELLGALLERAPGLTVLATSRAPLHIPGERVSQVGPLDLHADAPALFVNRAIAARPGFRLDADSRPLVRDICVQLGCMPLALDLAAARLRSMTVAELLDRLDERFRLLQAGRGALTGRHATLGAVVAWSYELLARDARHLLDRLWVFAGGFDAAAAHAMSTPEDHRLDELDTLNLLDTLVDHSLIQVREVDGRTRYSMLETLRQYAALRSSETERNDLRVHHAAYYLAFARTADECLRGRLQAAWLRRMETEHDNFRAALTWALGPDGDPATGPRVTAALWWFWRVRSHVEEGSRWYQLALDREPTPEAARDRMRALIGAGLLGYFQRTHESAVDDLEQARDEALRLGNDESAGWALHGLGRILLDRRDHEASIAVLRESIDFFRRSDNVRAVAYSTFFPGSASSFAGVPAPDVERHFDDAERTFRTSDDVWGLIGVSVVRAWQAALHHDAQSAARHYRDQLEGSMRIDSPWMAALAVFGLARSAAMAQSWLLAAELYGSGRAMCAVMGAQADRLAGPSEARSLQEAREAVGSAVVDAAWAIGRARTLVEAAAAGLRAAAEVTPVIARPSDDRSIRGDDGR